MTAQIGTEIERSLRSVLFRSAREGLRQRSNVSLLIGVVIVGVVVFVTVFAPLIGIPDPDAIDFMARLLPPSPGHLFGTDNLGRDVLSRVAYGGRIDLLLGVGATVASLLIGLVIGTAVGFFRGVAEIVVMRVVDLLLSLPFIVLILATIAIIGPGLGGVIVGMLAVGWTIYARITFSEMLVLRERQFVMAARTLGYGNFRVIVRHAMPNLFRPNIAFSLSDIVGNILALTALSYLGVGVQPPTPEWGALIAGGQGYILTAWWIATMPGLVVVVVGVGLTLIGEWISSRFSAGRSFR